MAEYEVLKDGATIHHYVADAYNADGKIIGEDVRSVLHGAGEVVSDVGEDRIAKHVKTAYDQGDEHVLSLLKKTSSVGGTKSADNE